MWGLRCEDSHPYSHVTMSSPLKQYACNQPHLNATLPDVCGMPVAPSWFFPAGPWTSAKHRFRASLCLTSGQRDGPLCMRNTCARRVWVRDTSITWQEPTRRAWLWAPWRHHTQSESADKIMMRDNMTAARALHVEKAALKNGILSWRQQRLYSILNDRNINDRLTRFAVSNC